MLHHRFAEFERRRRGKSLFSLGAGDGKGCDQTCRGTTMKDRTFDGFFEEAEKAHFPLTGEAIDYGEVNDDLLGDESDLDLWKRFPRTTPPAEVN